MQRFRIGTTRSGMTITTESESDGLTSPEDIFDALTILEAFGAREVRRQCSSEIFDQVHQQVEAWHKRLSQSGDLFRIQRVLRIQNYAERVKFGSQLLNREYRD